MKFNRFLNDVITKRGKRRSNYQYIVLENTPYLHGSETLQTMYDNAITNDQKASIMLHIDRFAEYTDGLPSYRKIRNQIWDDFK